VKNLKTHLLPQLINCSFEGSCAIVIDVLRASTTIVHGFGNVGRIWPCLSVEDARERKQKDSTLLLGGERECQIIDGFDLDNSPSSYADDQFAGREVAFTTTNGTKAMLMSKGADRVFIGSFANLNSVVKAVAEFDNIQLVCAGTNGEITSEDCLFAGSVVSGLLAKFECKLNDSSQMVLNHFLSIAKNDDSIYETLCKSRGGQNLIDVGMEPDIRICSTLNTHDVVPEFNTASQCIHSATEREDR
jgi:2-phosphosulfolactate phosphatase